MQKGGCFANIKKKLTNSFSPESFDYTLIQYDKI